MRDSSVSVGYDRPFLPSSYRGVMALNTASCARRMRSEVAQRREEELKAGKRKGRKQCKKRISLYVGKLHDDTYMAFVCL